MIIALYIFLGLVAASGILFIGITLGYSIASLEQQKIENNRLRLIKRE